MPLFSCEYETNAQPWKPEEMMKAARTAIESAGGKIIYEDFRTWTFMYQCATHVIDVHTAPFLQQVKIAKLNDEVDPVGVNFKSTKPPGLV